MSAQRMLFLSVASLLFVGIGLSGWENARRLLYGLAGLVDFAGIAGVCPPLTIYKKPGFNRGRFAPT